MTVPSSAAMDSAAATPVLLRLNEQYVEAFLNADAGWYRKHLVEDFVCIESDGSRIGREKFLLDAACTPDVATYTLKDVQIRFFGSVALIHATGEFVRPSGATGTSEYTDVWAFLDGEWKTVSAQITRVPASAR
jgi:hypothetical protein